MYRKQGKPKRENKVRHIYAIIFQRTGVVYVGKSTMRRLYQLYDEHHRERKPVTRALFREYKASGDLPQMFLLEDIQGTDADAFTRCLAWSMCFKEAGYPLLLEERLEEFLDEPWQETLDAYEKIKDCDLTVLCSEEKSLFPEFGRLVNKRREVAKNDENRRYRITVRMKRDDYDQIKALADEEGATVGEWMKMNAGNCCVIKPDMSWLQPYIEEMEYLNYVLGCMFATYVVSGEILPGDLEWIYDASLRVIEMSKEVCEQFKRITKLIRDKKVDQL